MALSRAMEVAASGLSMQRARMEIVASNLANAQTTRTADGGPYVRKLPVVKAVGLAGNADFKDALSRAVKAVRVLSVENDPRPPLLRFEPGHPDANGQGYVAYPNIDPAQEMTDMLSAIRSYEANTTVVKNVQRMNESALSIIR
jgi:flagellar basal-body rod protein FlgC